MTREASRAPKASLPAFVVELQRGAAQQKVLPVGDAAFLHHRHEIGLGGQRAHFGLGQLGLGAVVELEHVAAQAATALFFTNDDADLALRGANTVTGSERSVHEGTATRRHQNRSAVLSRRKRDHGLHALVFEAQQMTRAPLRLRQVLDLHSDDERDGHGTARLIAAEGPGRTTFRRRNSPVVRRGKPAQKRPS